MYIVTVIPLKKGIQGEYLSYFYSENLNPGTVVIIPVRSKEEKAIVVDSEEVLNLKSDIKNRDYQLKKILKVKGETPFSKNFFLACQISRKYFIGNTGTIIKSLLPSLFLENIDLLKKNNLENHSESLGAEKFIFQANEQDRIAFYRTLIRESFAKKESVFICVPTKYDLNIFYKELSKGIEPFTYLFHLELKKKEIIEKYNTAITQDHPVLIIGTGLFLSIHRPDIKTIIVEKESSEAYKQLFRPFIDLRSFAEIFAEISKIKLIFGDTLLRPETLNRYDNGELCEISSPSYRLFQTDKIEVVDMSKKEESPNSKFQILSNDVLSLIKNTIEEKSSTLLFSLRKGLAPITVCNDCRKTLLCPSCSTPIVLYEPKSKGESKNDTPSNRIFMCNKCGRKEKTATSCPNCGGWNLIPLGIGIDKVYQEIQKQFPDLKIYQVDKENTGNPSLAKEVVKKFYNDPGSILLGTEMVFSFLEEKIKSSAIISLDGLFSIPSFNMGQKIIHLIEKLNNLTLDKSIIQTRSPDNKILQSIKSGNVLSYLREDLNERKSFGYPPFKKLIKITFEGSSQETEKARSFLESRLGKYDPQIFSAFVGKVRGNYITNTVIKVDLDNWPLIENAKRAQDDNLYQTLKSLPPNFSINVDPEDLL